MWTQLLPAAHVATGVTDVVRHPRIYEFVHPEFTSNSLQDGLCER
jgi:hypothetical protein